MAESQKDDVVGEFQKNVQEIVRVSRRRYRGVDLIDARVFYRDTDDGGEEVWNPSRAGVALQVRQVAELIGLLQRAIGSGKPEEGEE